MIDISKPVENPGLVEAMLAFKKEMTPETEKPFVALLKDAHFLMLLEQGFDKQTADKEGTITLQKGAAISFPMVASASGQPLHIVFSDWDELRKWKNVPDQQTLVVSFSDLAQMILREDSSCMGFVINPGSQGFLVPRQIVANLSGRANPRKMEEGAKVMIGEPANVPPQLTDALTAKLQELQEVRYAWLLLMTQGQESSFLLVADHGDADRESVSQAVGAAVSAHLPEGMFLDFVSFSQPFGKEAATGHMPFYRKK